MNMAKLPSLPENAHLSQLFAQFPGGHGELMRFVDVVMRGEGELSLGERELIAAYVSGLNRCTYCVGAHIIYARAFGIDDGVLEALLENLDTAPVSEKMRALLGYLRVLNTLPSRLSQAGIDAVLGAGWSEKALFEAVRISGLFNMMNRIIEGTGVSFDYTRDASNHPATRLGDRINQHSYAPKPAGG
jgi:uncharacterized peroxidase-related enzyme